QRQESVVGMGVQDQRLVLGRDPVHPFVQLVSADGASAVADVAVGPSIRGTTVIDEEVVLRNTGNAVSAEVDDDGVAGRGAVVQLLELVDDCLTCGRAVGKRSDVLRSKPKLVDQNGQQQLHGR